MVVFIQNRALELEWKQTFKTYQFNENWLSIGRLKSEHHYSEKFAR